MSLDIARSLFFFYFGLPKKKRCFLLHFHRAFGKKEGCFF